MNIITITGAMTAPNRPIPYDIAHPSPLKFVGNVSVENLEIIIKVTLPKQFSTNTIYLHMNQELL